MAKSERLNFEMLTQQLTYAAREIIRCLFAAYTQYYGLRGPVLKTGVTCVYYFSPTNKNKHAVKSTTSWSGAHGNLGFCVESKSLQHLLANILVCITTHPIRMI